MGVRSISACKPAPLLPCHPSFRVEMEKEKVLSDPTQKTLVMWINAVPRTVLEIPEGIERGLISLLPYRVNGL
jgi:hypothetical protein